MINEEKQFQCQWDGCTKSFNRKTDVSRHYRIHVNDKPFKCTWPGCTKAFLQRSAVKIHFRTHTGEKPNLCPFEGCGKAFNDTSSLARHRRTHHTSQPFECKFQFCTYRSLSKKVLKDHERHAHSKSNEKTVDLVEARSQSLDLINQSFMMAHDPVPRPSVYTFNTSIPITADYKDYKQDEHSLISPCPSNPSNENFLNLIHNPNQRDFQSGVGNIDLLMNHTSILKQSYSPHQYYHLSPVDLYPSFVGFPSVNQQLEFGNIGEFRTRTSM